MYIDPASALKASLTTIALYWVTGAALKYLGWL